MPSRITISILVGYGAAIWFLTLLLGGISVEGFFQPMTYVVGAISVALLAFDRYVWSWWPLPGLLSRPDLRGTWVGTLDSDHVRAREPIDVALAVHQTFSVLRFRLISQESQSIANIASIVVEPDERISVLSVYRNEPRIELQARSRPHRGALQVMIDGAEGDKLTGEYWTDRKTTGRVELRRISREQAKGWEHAKALADESEA